MPKPFLTILLAHPDLAAQAAHLARGALYLPEPEPLPEPSTDLTLRVETAAGTGVELDARVVQILPGHGIVVAFDDLAGARAKLAPLFAEPKRAGGDDDATFIFWGRMERPLSVRPVPRASIAKLTLPVATPPAPAVGVDRAARSADAPSDEPPPSSRRPYQDEPQAGAPQIELDETRKMEAEIATLNTNQKMQLAMKGSRVARTLLLKDVNKNLQTFILQNPRITLDEVRALAANRQAMPDILNTIAANKDWGNNPNIVTALVRNPKTPGSTAAKLMDKVPIAEVRRLAKANDVPRAVVSAARKRLEGAA